MRQFYLRASFRHQRRTWWFTAADDRDAVRAGAKHVLQLGNDRMLADEVRQIWMYGWIEVINDLGVVLTSTTAKDYANGGV